MLKILSLAAVQSACLVLGQVFLKYAMARMQPFGWTWAFWGSLLANWQFALCGLFFLCGSLLWIYMLKTWPFSVIYPLSSLSYVFGMAAAVLFFHESVPAARWAGVALIMAGCCLVVK